MNVADRIHEANQRFMRAIRAADRATMPSLYTKDAVILPPNADAVTGDDEIAQFWQAFFELGIGDARPVTLEVIPMGEYALEVGETTVFGADGALVDRGKIMVLWKNEAGTWKMHRDTWNSSVPLAASEQQTWCPAVHGSPELARAVIGEDGSVITERSVRGYLDRLGIERRPPATLDGLRMLHRAHLERIPFENLSIHLGEAIVLEQQALVAKIVDRRRGGFCYELNGAFAALLRALGYEVTLLAARVLDGEDLGPPFDHMCLRVELDEPWLADVGFGDNFRLPLRLNAQDEQADEAGAFRIVPVGDGQLDVLRDGQPQYRFDLIARELADYEATCRYHQTSPESHFTRNTVCSLATAEGRVTIRGNTLIVTRGGDRSERALTDAELKDAYRQHFGIELDLPLDQLR